MSSELIETSSSNWIDEDLGEIEVSRHGSMVRIKAFGEGSTMWLDLDGTQLLKALEKIGFKSY
jgi:hypothetical protein